MRLFAALGTWMEEDVVAATVRNAYQQGCERVYLIDNDSPDRTVDIAIAAGAELAERFPSRGFDEDTRNRLMNDVMHRVSASLTDPNVWWLWLDADEFPHGPAGLTVRDYLQQLDARFRIIGARYFNHYPSGAPQYVAGRHPIDFQPLCDEYPEAHCAVGHHKHPLVRVDRDGPAVSQRPGFHRAASQVRLLEPTDGLFLHHFPYREQAVTRARLHRLCRELSLESMTRDTPGANAVLREANLDAIYANRWAEVREWRGRTLSPIHPRPWSSLVSATDQVIARWY